MSVLGICGPYMRHGLTQVGLRLASEAEARGLTITWWHPECRSVGPVELPWDNKLPRYVGLFLDYDWIAQCNRVLWFTRPPSYLVSMCEDNDIAVDLYITPRSKAELYPSYNAARCFSPLPHVLGELKKRHLPHQRLLLGSGWRPIKRPARPIKRILWPIYAEDAPDTSAVAIDTALRAVPANVELRVLLYGAGLSAGAKRHLRGLKARGALSVCTVPSRGAAQLEFMQADLVYWPTKSVVTGMAIWDAIACSVPIVCYAVPPLDTWLTDDISWRVPTATARHGLRVVASPDDNRKLQRALYTAIQTGVTTQMSESLFEAALCAEATAQADLNAFFDYE